MLKAFKSALVLVLYGFWVNSSVRFFRCGGCCNKKNFRAKADAADQVLHIHLFSHTHWDFESYEVQEGFKLQLVRLIDHLLNELETDPKFKFHFDGQVMPIEDYLEVLRERDDLDDQDRTGAAKQKITQFVGRGQLKIGPCWMKFL